MKILNILIALVFVYVFVACDIVEPPYTKNNNQNPVDTTKRNVLIEDFTGFRCGNCPEASHVAEQVADLYKGKVFSIALHAGPLSIPTPVRKYDFRTPETKELAEYYGLVATPYGMVNRRKYNDQTLQAPSAWSGYATETLQLEAILKISLNNVAYNQNNKQISLDIKLDYLKNSEISHFVAVYIVEDSIVNYQQDDRQFPNVHIVNFVHNHVMRGSFSGTWGTPVSQAVISAGSSVNLPHSYTIPAEKDWRPEKLSLIVFVQNNDTKEILQVEKVALFK